MGVDIKSSHQKSNHELVELRTSLAPTHSVRCLKCGVEQDAVPLYILIAHTNNRKPTAVQPCMLFYIVTSLLQKVSQGSCHQSGFIHLPWNFIPGHSRESLI